MDNKLCPIYFMFNIKKQFNLFADFVTSIWYFVSEENKDMYNIMHSYQTIVTEGG